MTQPGAMMFLPEQAWRERQAAALRRHLAWARQGALYREASIAVDAEGISAATLEQAIAALPLTSKDDLARAGAAAHRVPREGVAEWVCTSGTLGKPLDVPLSRRDMERLAANESAALSLAGIGAGDLVLLAVGMERLFVAGQAYWMGAQALLAACVRAGPRIAEHPAQLRELLARFAGASQKVFVISVPSYLLRAFPPERPLAGIIGIGEPVKAMPAGGAWREARLSYNRLGEQLRDRFGCPVMSTYAMTETCTTFAEGPCCAGGHLNPELAVLEVLDEHGRPAAEGTVGEVVVTPLGTEAMPLLRFRTGDMAAMQAGVCGCGRTTPRIGPIVGRRQQLLKVRGVSLYPQAVIEALRAMPAVQDCAIVARSAADLSDELTIHVCAAAGATARLPEEIAAALRAQLRIAPTIEMAGAEEIQALQLSAGRKATRFIDRRSR